jgi:hypothetical protein
MSESKNERQLKINLLAERFDQAELMAIADDLGLTQRVKTYLSPWKSMDEASRTAIARVLVSEEPEAMQKYVDEARAYDSSPEAKLMEHVAMGEPRAGHCKVCDEEIAIDEEARRADARAYDESTNPSNGWRSPVPELKVAKTISGKNCENRPAHSLRPWLATKLVNVFDEQEHAVRYFALCGRCASVIELLHDSEALDGSVNVVIEDIEDAMRDAYIPGATK